jgi:hypothetical protein
MTSSDSTIHHLLGPRAKPSFLVRFGIWFVVAILAVTALIGSLISYREETGMPVQFIQALPIRSEVGGGRIRFSVADGTMIETHQVIARLEPRDPGVAVAVARIPVPLSATIRAGDLLACDIRDTNGLHRRTAKVDSVLITDSQGIVVRLVVAGQPAKGVLRVAGQDHSVLYRLVTSLLKK